MVDATSGVGSSSSTNGTGGTQAKTGLGKDFGDFLKLLTVQLKNQDPTSPLDANQFTNQIISFSQVEQTVNMNENLQKLVNLSQTNQLNNAVTYIGTEVEFDGSQASLSNGKAEFSYNIDGNAAKTVISVSDNTGKMIFATEGDATKGKHTFTWNGTTNDGVTAKDGNYKISVAAVDQTGKEVATTTTVKGIVTDVSVNNGTPFLKIGDTQVDLGKILSVGIPRAAIPTPTSSAAGNTQSQGGSTS